MIRLGLRLTFAGGREAITRLALIAMAVAIGSALLLTTVAGLRAVNAQNARYGWLETGFPGSNAPALTVSTPAAAGQNPLWWTLTIEPQFFFAAIEKSFMPGTTWPTSDVTTGQLQALPVDLLVVGTDGSPAAVESARTVLEHSWPTRFAPQTISEYQADSARLLDDYRRLADVVMLTSLPIAGLALAISIAGGLADRRRPFSLLRLTGVPLGLLRRVVGLEAAAPLLITAAVPAGAGLLAAHLFLRAQLGERLVAPGPQYYVVIAAGLLTALAMIASTLPLLNQLTGPETARNE